jgi:alpha-ketoglutarate-dependent taurine dioxygenase
MRIPELPFGHAARVLERAATHGAVLLRGCPDEASFAAYTQTLGLKPFDYVGGAAPRTRIQANVFTANESPADATIPLHHELAQASARPSHLVFYCDVPAARGGATVVVDSRQVAAYVARVHPSLAAKLDEGVRYRRVMPSEDDASSPIGRSWKSCFGVATRAEAERAMRAAGMDWAWRDDTLWTQTRALPAFRHAPRSDGSLAFCNSILAAYRGWTDARNHGPDSVRFADGTRLPEDAVEDVYAFAWSQRYEAPWSKGDVLVVDNDVAMHARTRYVGERRVLASLLAPP